MGSRLGVIVKTVDGWELYYDHWAAQTVGADIALDGHDETLQRVRQMVPMGVDSPEEWEGATWIEGTLFIDETTKTVVWAEESEALYLPRLINHIIEYSWPEWTAIWAAEGTWSTLRAAGVDPWTIFSSASDPVELAQSAREIYPWEELHGVDPISVRLMTGELVHWRATDWLDDLASLGPDRFYELATEIQRRKPTELRDWEEVGWRAAVNRDSQTEGESPEYEQIAPTGGIHVDYVTQTIRWWSIRDRYWHIPVLAQLWPDWQVQCESDEYTWQEELIGEPIRDWLQDIEQCKTRLLRDIAEGPRENPFTRIAGALADLGSEVTPFPETLEFIPAQRGMDYMEVRTLLESLDWHGLPPALIIDHRGEIIQPFDPWDRALSQTSQPENG